MIKKLTGLLIIVVLFSYCKSTYYPGQTVVEYERVSESNVIEDQELESIIAPYREELDGVMNEVIGHLDTILFKSRPESSMGNWLADMIYEEANLKYDEPIDFAIQNHGGLRVPSLAAGPLTVGEVIEVMPFDNKISIIESNGEGVLEFMNHMARGGGWPISHATFKIQDNKAIDVKINGEPLDLSKVYRYAIPDYIAGGGSGCDFLKAHKREDFEVFLRDEFINNIKRDTKNGITQYARLEGRVVNLDR